MQPPSTIVAFDEKELFLPSNGQPIIVNNQKSRARVWYKIYILLFGLFFYIFFNLMNKLYTLRESEDQNVNTDNIYQLESLKNEDVLHTGIFASCQGTKGPTIPYKGQSDFQFDQQAFSHLSIDQRTNTHRGTFLQITNGNTVVSIDETISRTSITFDLKFDHEELQDVFWIEQTEDKVQGVYSLIIRADESYSYDGCISINIDIRVPNLTALTTLTISLANNGISLKEGLILEKLAVSVANGYIEFEEGISSGNAVFTVANGHVSGKINTLSNDLTSSVANGYTEIAIKQIEQATNEDISIQAAVANGHNDLRVPSSFNSQFQLESFAGRHIIESTYPQNIHRRSGRWGAIFGYYGNDKDTRNSVILKTSSGGLKLTYV
ncbi:hypothetical protein BD408DRAFT_418513 [Parasitella parasitica]|nr:hypothetical protein BD408DRAFT_418513 [Parasitella parasitica]